MSEVQFEPISIRLKKDNDKLLKACKEAQWEIKIAKFDAEHFGRINIRPKVESLLAEAISQAEKP